MGLHHGRFFATAKTHKVESIKDIFLDNLNLRPIINQTKTYIYNASRVVAKYLRPLFKNEIPIADTLSFPGSFKNNSNYESYEDVSYDFESLFTSIPVQETLGYILQRIYVCKEIKPFCNKSIFKKFLLKLTKECIFSLNHRPIKQTDCCPMGSHISVVCSDLYVSKIEQDIATSMKPHFYKRYVDDTSIRRNKNEPNSLFEKLFLSSKHKTIY